MTKSRPLGVHSLDHFALTVPSLASAQCFFSDFGLDPREQGEALAVHTFDSAQRWAFLTEGRTKRLLYLSFGIYEQDRRAFERHLQSLNVARLDPPPGVASDGLWLRDPDGTLIELRVAPKTSPARKCSGEFRSSPAGKSGAPKRSQAPQSRPTRLAHCLLFTRNVPTAITFFCRTLGLRLADRAGDDIAFLHGAHGSDHHVIAFARSNAPGLHHSAWDVRSLDEIGLGAMQMAERGHAGGWGIGRHVLGSNYFHYVRDPWNSYAEYSCDMDFIPADARWVAQDHDAEDAFYVWGPQPPADFTHNYEADQS